MRATLTFRLPEERDEHVRALRGSEAIDALSGISDRLRRLTKHEVDGEVVDAAMDAAGSAVTSGARERAEAIVRYAIDYARAEVWAEIRERGLAGMVNGDE